MSVGDQWQANVERHGARLRWAAPPWFWILTVGCAPFLITVMVLGQANWFTALMALLVVVVLGRQLTLVRATELLVSDGGLERVNRGREYRIRVPWEEISGVTRTRVLGFQRWMLEYAPQPLLPLDSRDRVSDRSAARALRWGFDHRFPIGPFAGDPRSGWFAEQLHVRRPDLGDVGRSTDD